MPETDPIRLPTSEQVSVYFSDWLRRENVRLHGPGDSLLTDLTASRRASELPYGNRDNTNGLKASQPLDRLRFKVQNIVEVNASHEFAGRINSDVLKLLAGFRVRKLMAQAHDPEDFRERLLDPGLSVDRSVEAGFSTLDPGLPLSTAYDAFHNDAVRSLEEYSRVATGSYWGVDHTPLTTAAEQGEVATIRIGLAVIGFVARQYGRLAEVPVRAPAADAEDTVLEYPFNTEPIKN